jgi:hypothetical protein
MNTPPPVVTNDTATPLHVAFQAAYDSGKKHPKMHFPDFTISRAPDTGRNAGCLYVKKDASYEAMYLGKITPAGTFIGIKDLPHSLDTLRPTIETACKVPLELAQETGRTTGTCCCCGRTLTNTLSVQLGIGPICREGWFPEAPPVTPELLGLDAPPVAPDILADMALIEAPLNILGKSPLDYVTEVREKEKLPKTTVVDEMVGLYNSLTISQKIEFQTKLVITAEVTS